MTRNQVMQASKILEMLQNLAKLGHAPDPTAQSGQVSRHMSSWGRGAISHQQGRSRGGGREKTGARILSTRPPHALLLFSVLVKFFFFWVKCSRGGDRVNWGFLPCGRVFGVIWRDFELDFSEWGLMGIGGIDV